MLFACLSVLCIADYIIDNPRQNFFLINGLLETNSKIIQLYFDLRQLYALNLI